MSAWAEAIVKIHEGANPFDGYKAGDGETWEHWDSLHPYFAEEILARRPRYIVEVGTFLGGSAIHMARLLRDNNIDGAVICIDTWLAEYALWLNAEHRPRLKITHGRPEFYHTFMSNVMAAGLQNYIVPLPMSSVQGIRLLSLLKIAPEIIYHDAEHERGDVEFCLRRIIDELKPKCLIVDDYTGAWPGVVYDVDIIRKVYGPEFDNQGQKARLSWR